MIRAPRVSWDTLTRLPPTATPRGSTFSSGAVLIGAGALVLVSLALPGGPVTGRGTVAVLASAGIVLGALYLRVGERLPRWTLHALIMGSVVMVTIAVRAAPDDAAAVTRILFYLLALANVFGSCSWVGALGHVLVVLAGVVLGMGGLSAPNPSNTFVVVGVLMMLSFLMGRLVRAAAAVEVDVLTALPNRRGLERRMETELSRCQRTGTPLALAVVDLDHFKAVNDVEGHAAGDRLLREVARAWSAALPAGAVLARWGGDEFVLLVPATVVLDAVEVIADLRAVMPAGRTCSAGVATWVAGESASMLTSRADTALYAAKRRQRGTTQSAPHPGATPARRPGPVLAGAGTLLPHLDSNQEPAG